MTEIILPNKGIVKGVLDNIDPNLDDVVIFEFSGGWELRAHDVNPKVIEKLRATSNRAPLKNAVIDCLTGKISIVDKKAVAKKNINEIIDSYKKTGEKPPIANKVKK